MKSKALIAAFYLVMMTLTFSAVEAAEGKRYALIVGVRTYRAGQPLPDLPFTENDASELAKTLEAGGYQVTLMTQAVGRTEGKEVMTPLSDFIRDQLDAMLDNPFLTDEDIVIVALAGHGVQYELIEGDGDDAMKTQKFYFCPSDAEITRLKTANDITDRNRLLDLGELYDALNRCKAGGKLLLVDACRNDPTKPGVTRSLASATLPPLPPPPGGTAAFFSCSAHQKAFEDEDLQHGVFFHHVIDALKGDADSSTSKRPADGQITLSELSEHVSSSTYDYVRTKFNGARQAPELKGEFRLTIPIISNLTKEPRPEKRTALPLSFSQISGTWTLSERSARSPSLPIAQLALTDASPKSFSLSCSVKRRRGNGHLLLVVPGGGSDSGALIEILDRPQIISSSAAEIFDDSAVADRSPAADRPVDVRVVVSQDMVEIFQNREKVLTTRMNRSETLPKQFHADYRGLSFVSISSSFDISNIQLEHLP